MSARRRRAEVVADLGAVVVLALNGRPRDPLEGRHRAAVVLVAADARPGPVAALLREAADGLEQLQRAVGPAR